MEEDDDGDVGEGIRNYCEKSWLHFVRMRAILRIKKVLPIERLP